MFRSNTVAAVVHPAQHDGHIFQRFLLGELRHKDHTMIAGVAACAQNIVDGVLGNRKSEGCKDCTLRFFNAVDLFCFRWDGQAIQKTQL